MRNPLYEFRYNNEMTEHHDRLGFSSLLAGLKASAEDTRFRLLALLGEEELTVSDLTDILRQSQPRISRHLKLLSDAGLIERFREGSWAFHRRVSRGPGAKLEYGARLAGLRGQARLGSGHGAAAPVERRRRDRRCRARPPGTR